MCCVSQLCLTDTDVCVCTSVRCLQLHFEHKWPRHRFPACVSLLLILAESTNFTGTHNLPVSSQRGECSPRHRRADAGELFCFRCRTTAQISSSSRVAERRAHHLAEKGNKVLKYDCSVVCDDAAAYDATYRKRLVHWVDTWKHRKVHVRKPYQCGRPLATNQTGQSSSAS